MDTMSFDLLFIASPTFHHATILPLPADTIASQNTTVGRAEVRDCDFSL